MTRGEVINKFDVTRYEDQLTRMSNADRCVLLTYVYANKFFEIFFTMPF